MLDTLLKTTAWVAASTSVLVTALMTLMPTWQPELRTTVLSSGKWSVPHVDTSVAPEFGRFLVKMNSKSSGSWQLLIAGKFTFTVVLAGTMGLEED